MSNLNSPQAGAQNQNFNHFVEQMDWHKPEFVVDAKYTEIEAISSPLKQNENE